MGIVYMKIF